MDEMSLNVSNNGNTANVANANEVTEEKIAKSETDVLPFLKGLKLEEYHDKMVECGGDKLGQLIYVDDQIIDDFCKEIKMKVIHAGVFKRALRECRFSNRPTSQENPDRTHANGQEVHSRSSRVTSQYIHHCQENSLINERSKMFTTENSLYNGIQRSTPITTQGPTDNLTQSKFNASIHPEILARQSYRTEDHMRTEHEKTPHPVEPTNQPSNKSSEYVGSGLEIVPETSYVVQVHDRMVRFPSTVKRLTIIERIDIERLEIIRKGAQIYGRDDTKRKNNELTPLEVFMNEMAYEICLRDFTYMVSRQKLLGLVREIYKDNQLQLSGHHHSTSILSNMNFTTKNTIEKPKKQEVSSSVVGNTVISASNESTPRTMTDYDILLYYKINREWPYNISREAKKYLGRRSSSFELIDNSLYYVKDNRRRLWIDDKEDTEKTFFKFHIDKDSGSHYSKDATIDRIAQFYYIKNLSQVMNDMFLKCSSCQENLRSTFNELNRRRSSNRILPKDDNLSFISSNTSNVCSEMPPLTALDSNHKRTFLESNTTEHTHIKRPRKSTPKKLVLANLENDTVDLDTVHNSVSKNMSPSHSTNISDSTIFQDSTMTAHPIHSRIQEENGNILESNAESREHSE